MRAGPDHGADDRDRAPQAEHRGPIEQPEQADARAAARFAPAAHAGGFRLALGRSLVVVVGLDQLASGS